MKVTFEPVLDRMSANVGGLSRLRQEAAGIMDYAPSSDLMRQVLMDVPAVIDSVLDEWRKSCAMIVDRVPRDAVLRGEEVALVPGHNVEAFRAEWLRYIEKTEKMVQAALHIAEWFENQPGPPPVSGKVFKRHLASVRRLLEGLRGMKTSEDALAVAVQWPRVNRDAFIRSANTFIPSQELYDDKWD
jgi:hypothetical protein